MTTKSLRRMAGFTLMEMLITVAIIGIIAAIAYPSYQRHVTSTWRVKAASCLVELAQGMERRYTANMSFAGTELPANGCVAELEERYVFSFPEDTDPTANKFILQAIPQGIQKTQDTQCATLQVDHTGAKTVSGSASVKDCFK